MRRSPYGERGLKYELYDGKIRTAGRSPYGERGLKSLMVAGVVVPEAVALLTGSVVCNYVWGVAFWMLRWRPP